MRKLASVQKVKELLPIDGADKIELCLINGWQVIVQKGIHKVDDLVVFFEIDSFLPASDERYSSFEERFVNWGNKRGMRVRTIKLRKQLSQGVVMPLSTFPEIVSPVEGLDVTESLKIEKWEPIEELNTNQRNPGSSAGKKFPAFIPKTDQERVQNYGEIVSRCLDEEFEVTMKKDGSSMTVFRVDPESPYYNDARDLVGTKLSIFGKIKRFFTDLVYGKDTVYGICSRNLLLPYVGDSNFHYAACDVLNGLAMIDKGSFAVQGEVVAPNIQNNHERVSGVEFHMFDVFDIDNQRYLLPEQREKFTQYTGVHHATILKVGTLRDILDFKEGDDLSSTSIVKKCLDYAEGPGDNAGVIREGVVFKSMKRDFSFKAVSNSYLLKTGK